MLCSSKLKRSFNTPLFISPMPLVLVSFQSNKNIPFYKETSPCTIPLPC